METNLISKWCRICSTEFNSGIFLFGEEAKRLFLHAKIQRYLALTISVEDKLPKMICKECWKKLEYFHRFANMALKNQDKMTKFVCTNLTTDNNQSETRSLLHTYLTKGIIEKDNTESEVTEMEVRIDPMLILQYSQEHEDDNGDEHDDDNDNDIEKIQQDNLSEDENCENYQKYTRSLTLQNHDCNHQIRSKILLNNHDNDNNEETEKKNNDDIDDDTDQEPDDSDNCDDDDDDDNDDDGDDSDDNKTKNFSCPICAKIISTKSNLKVHLETHRPKGKYGCDICGRIFKTQCNLFRHKEYHGGIQYPCPVCGRVYPTNSTLRAHSITHSDLRPHKCPLCDKTFKRNQDLKFHINQHTGARPYQCPYCPKAFASSGNCFSHRKRMHPVEVERDRERAAKIIR